MCVYFKIYRFVTYGMMVKDLSFYLQAVKIF